MTWDPWDCDPEDPADGVTRPDFVSSSTRPPSFRGRPIDGEA